MLNNEERVENAHGPTVDESDGKVIHGDANERFAPGVLLLALDNFLVVILDGATVIGVVIGTRSCQAQ